MPFVVIRRVIVVVVVVRIMYAYVRLCAYVFIDQLCGEIGRERKTERVVACSGGVEYSQIGHEYVLK